MIIKLQLIAMKINSLYDKLTGKCIRKISFEGSPQNAIYLTFDDGPDPVCTPKVLNILNKFQAKATFFVIGQKAKVQKKIISDILSQGHSIGDHTIDHDTSNYFKNERKISNWLEKSSDLLKSELNINSVGFRSPLGIKTPALNKILNQKKIPLILWNIRFYDTNYDLNLKKIDKKLNNLQNGSIILLHDTHKGKNLKKFLEGLEYLICECQKRKYIFLPLTEQLIYKTFLGKYEIK